MNAVDPKPEPSAGGSPRMMEDSGRDPSLGTGTGTFGAATNFAVPINPWGVALGDINRDGYVDGADIGLLLSNWG